LNGATPLLAAVAILLAAGVGAGLLAQRLRVPDVVLYLLAGVALGPAFCGVLVLPADSSFCQLVLTFGAAYILFEGGSEVKLEVLARIWVGLTALATAGVLVTVVVVAAAAHWSLDLDVPVALLLGAVIAPTDPATLIPVFRQVKVRGRLAQMVVSESAFNDAVGAILTFTLLSLVTGHGHLPAAAVVVDFAREAGLGLLAGLLLGYLTAFLIGHHRFGLLSEYAPLATLLGVVGAYPVVEGLHGSGFMAVFVAGVVVGNRERFSLRLAPDATRRMHEYAGTTALLLRMAIFILLGTQVRFQVVGAHLGGALAVTAILMFLARPLSVFLCAAPDRRAGWELRELLFMCWTRETGVIPGALAGMLLSMGAPEAETLAAVTFTAILATLLLQATTTRWLAARLDLLEV